MMILDAKQADVLKETVRIRKEQIKTGFAELDKEVNFRKGDVMMIGARPKMGLTSLCLNIVGRLAFGQTKKVAYFWGDRPPGREDILAEHLIGIAAAVPQKMIRLRELRPYEQERFDEAAGKMCNGNISIENGYGVTPADIEAKLDGDLKGTEVVIIDSFRGLDLGCYKDKVLSPARHACYCLKDIAQRKNVAVILTYKVGKQVETKRADHRPMIGCGDMNIARDSGVDIAGFLYRDEYYDSCSKDKGIAEFIIEKGGVLPIRNTVSFRIDPETHRFYDNGNKEQGSDPFRCEK